MNLYILRKFEQIDISYFVWDVFTQNTLCPKPITKSKEALEMVWGSFGKSRGREDYPEKRKVWEQEVLAPFL